MTKKSDKKAINYIESQGYQVLSHYERAQDKLDLICERGHNCSISWHNFNHGTRCKTCKFENQVESNRKKAFGKIKERSIKQNLKLISDISDYADKNSRIKFQREDGTIFETCLSNILMNKNNVIDGETQRRMPQLTIDQVNSKVGNNITLISDEYVNNMTPLVFKCNKEGHEFTKVLKNLRNSCPICNIPSTELKWCNFLDNLEIKYILHYKLEGVELDIYLPNEKIAIECCGLFFHSIHDKLYDKVISKKQHFEKRELCEKNNIRLFTIYDNENDSPIIESMIMNSLGKSTNRYFARKLKIKVVSAQEAKCFLNNNHLMGYSTSKFIGLYDKEELICLMGYKQFKKDGRVEIDRFVTLIETNVVGGFSKLLKHVVRETNTKKIVSYLDLRYSNGASYKALNFTRVSVSLGWKWTDFTNTYNRRYCRANMDHRKISENSHAKEMKLYKIYDAGQAKYELNL